MKLPTVNRDHCERVFRLCSSAEGVEEVAERIRQEQPMLDAFIAYLCESSKNQDADTETGIQGAAIGVFAVLSIAAEEEAE